MKHLPYKIDPDNNRFHYYELLWKQIALDLIDSVSPSFSCSSKTLLDYGCGRGELLKLAKDKGYFPVGLDTDPQCVTISKNISDCFLFDGHTIPASLQEFQYDVVCCLHVLEHVPNPMETLLLLKSLSRKYVIIAVPNLKILTGLFSRKIRPYQVNQGHLQSWDHETLYNLAVEHVGLKHLAWGFDTTILPVLSQISLRLFGNKFTIYVEKNIFVKLFPHHCHSLIALFEIQDS